VDAIWGALLKPEKIALWLTAVSGKWQRVEVLVWVIWPAAALSFGA
jgi:hypothetical protein